MKLSHSYLYLTENLVQDTVAGKRLSPEVLTSWIQRQPLPVYDLAGQSLNVYGQLTDLLREVNDAQFGIVAKFDQGLWVRDATDSTPLDMRRISHDAPLLEANNALLRCLSRFQAIDYAIAKKHPGDTVIRGQMNAGLVTLIRAILKGTQDSGRDVDQLANINVLEKAFDTFLMRQLHEANLTKGCFTADDAKSLLFHYRILSSVLFPARPMVTLTYDRQSKVFQRETQWPVVAKSVAQHEAIQKLRDINPHPLEEEDNAHYHLTLAEQEADSLFADLIDRDDRALPAQARKTHLVGVKNGFIVRNELIFLRENESLISALRRGPEDGDTLWFGRSGSPVFVGKGERDEQLQRHTQENLNQIRRAAKIAMGLGEGGQLSLHLTTLNTVSPLEHQAKIVRHLYAATRELHHGDDISYAPINPDGTFRFLDIAPSLPLYVDGSKPKGIAPLQKATRLDSAVSVMLSATERENTLSIVQCASGQDRTGTVVEKGVQKWMETRYRERGQSPVNIQVMRAEGANAAEMATHFVPGSPGMKKSSIALNMFGRRQAFEPLVTNQLYRKSADTSKSNPIDRVDFLRRVSEKGREEYLTNLLQFSQALEQFSQSYQKLPSHDQKAYKVLHQGGTELMTYIESIAGTAPEKLDAQSVSDFSAILKYSTQAIQHPEEGGSLRKLTSLSKVVSGHESPQRKKLGALLLEFVAVAFIVAAVVMAVPSGGLSLLPVVGGVLGIAVCASAGAILYCSGQEKGLAEKLTYFKAGLDKIPKREEGGAELPWTMLC